MTAANAGDDRRPRSANDLLRARLGGRITRRELIERGLELGLSLPVVGVLLRATGDHRAAAAGTLVPATKASNPGGPRRKGGTLNVGVVGAIDSLNPYIAGLYGPSFEILSGVMQGLLTVDSKQRLRPALAEEYAIGDDGVTYVFTLRRGVRWHNGDRFVADDVIRTWKMVMNEDFPAWQRTGWEKIDAITAGDDGTLTITTSEVYGPFLSNLSAGAFNNAVISPARFLKKGPGRFVRDSATPIGTGPFRYVERRGKEIVLERNPGYWGGSPELEQVVVRLYDDYAAQVQGLAVGEVDLIAHTGMPGASRMADALAIDGIDVYAYPGLTWGHFDLKQVGFLTETAVRQALDYATPRDTIIAEVLANEAVPAAADQSPGSWAYDQSVEPRPYSLSRAEKLLAGAGFAKNDAGILERDGEPFRIELWGESSDPQAPGILNITAASWKQLGIDATVKFEKKDVLWGPTGYQYTDRMTAGYYRWSNVNDPDDTFYWHSSQIPTSPGGAGGNIPAFFHEYAFQDRIDGLTSRAAAETDRSKRKALYAEIQAVLRKEVPVIFLFWDNNYSAASAKIGGFWPSAFNYLLWNAGDWYLTD